MTPVNNLLFVLLLLLLPVLSYGQSTSKRLKQEQARLERQIANTKSLLAKTQSDVKASLTQLKMIENQIKFREQLLRNYDNQIRNSELKIQQKEKEIGALSEKLKELKEQYKQLLIYSYKKRNKYGKMMYIFSAENYNDAIKRKKYLERIAELQKKQFLIIQQTQRRLKEDIKTIEKEKTYQMALLSEKKKEKEAIEKDKEQQIKIYQEIKSREKELLAKLREEEKRRRILKEKIDAAIRREIALAEARRKRLEAERKRKAKESGKTTTKETPSITLKEREENAKLNLNFSGNRGRLPWPVSKGSITEGFGKNPHPTLKNVYTNNRGVDITTAKNAQVRAVFDGEVTSVLNIPGAGKVVIIKHGNYRTVYSNLKDTYVTKGHKVKTKQVIGSLLSKGNVSIAHFELHQVTGNNVTCLNPSLWLAK